MKTVIFILCPNMLATSLTLPLEMMRAAWAMAKTQHHRLPPLEVQYRSENGKPVMTHTGLLLPADTLDAPTPLDSLVFLPALWRNPLKIVERSPKIQQWLMDIAPNNTIAAVGSGVCFVAETGLLDHKPATTHWHFFKAFSHRYPNVQLKRDVFITRSQRLFCTASINALAELTAFFIQEEYGQRIAQAVERNFFHEIRQPKTQAGLDTITHATTDEIVALATAKLDDQINHLSGSAPVAINIGQLAKELDVSVRSLNRHFQQAMNISPLQYVQKRRLAIAEELLKTSNLSIADIASQIGYYDPQHFGRLFKKLYHVPPRQYRMTVRSKLFT